MRKERWIFSSDYHAPFHDPRILDIIFTVAKDIDATHFVINGDFLDFINVNMWGPKHPDIVETLEDEFYSGRKILEEIRNLLPNTKIILTHGNHESRLERFILKNARPFWNVLKVDSMLDVSRYDVETHPYQHVVQIPNIPFYFTHSPASYGKHPASVSLDKKGEGNWLWSCAHRASTAYKTTSLGSTWEAHTIGWCGHTSLTDSHKQVFSFTKGHESWNSSFVIVELLGENYFISHHLIRDYKVGVMGYMYES